MKMLWLCLAPIVWIVWRVYSNPKRVARAVKNLCGQFAAAVGAVVFSDDDLLQLIQPGVAAALFTPDRRWLTAAGVELVYPPGKTLHENFYGGNGTFAIRISRVGSNGTDTAPTYLIQIVHRAERFEWEVVLGFELSIRDGVVGYRLNEISPRYWNESGVKRLKASLPPDLSKKIRMMETVALWEVLGEARDSYLHQIAEAVQRHWEISGGPREARPAVRFPCGPSVRSLIEYRPDGSVWTISAGQVPNLVRYCQSLESRVLDSPNGDHPQNESACIQAIVWLQQARATIETILSKDWQNRYAAGTWYDLPPV